MADDKTQTAGAPKPSGVPMRGPKGCATTLSHAGRVYEADKTGAFTVPEHAVESLKRHGFRVVGGEKAEG